MKTRNGFVSNSSSSSFYITNKSDKPLTIVDFVEENPQLLEEFKETYDWFKDDIIFTQKNMIKGAKNRLKEKSHTHDGVSSYVIPSKKRQFLTFGDEDGDVIGRVFDYILRDGGSSENFEWECFSVRGTENENT